MGKIINIATKLEGKVEYNETHIAIKFLNSLVAKSVRIFALESGLKTVLNNNTLIIKV